MTGIPPANDSPQNGPSAPGAGIAAEGLMQALVATATEGILSIATDGTIETVNRAAERMFGYGPGELLGRNVTLLMPSPHRDEHAGYVERYLRTREARIIGIGREIRGVRKDGSEIPIDLSVGEGSVGGRRFFVGILRDITERKEMQSRLALNERLAAIGELAAGVAHEVNNPINTILNCAQLIRDGDAPQEHADTITAEGRRVAAIVHDLLSFARDDRQATTPVAIGVVIERTVHLVRESLRANNIRLELRLAADAPLLRSHPQRLQQVLLNLVINAKDALTQAKTVDPMIEIATATVHGGVELTVRDNGPGVPAAIRNHVFEPFVTTKRGRGGTGLGLSISKNIVEDQGGSISLAPPSGAGAEFRVWIPALANPSPDPAR